MPSGRILKNMQEYAFRLEFKQLACLPWTLCTGDSVFFLLLRFVIMVHTILHYFVFGYYLFPLNLYAFVLILRTKIKIN